MKSRTLRRPCAILQNAPPGIRRRTRRYDIRIAVRRKRSWIRGAMQEKPTGAPDPPQAGVSASTGASAR